MRHETQRNSSTTIVVTACCCIIYLVSGITRSCISNNHFDININSSIYLSYLVVSIKFNVAFYDLFFLLLHDARAFLSHTRTAVVFINV